MDSNVLLGVATPRYPQITPLTGYEAHGIYRDKLARELFYSRPRPATIQRFIRVGHR